MARPVTCRKCKAKGYSDVFLCHITNNNQKMYFCCQECMDSVTTVDVKFEELIHFVREATNINTFNKGNVTFITKYLQAYKNNGMFESLHYILKTQRHQIRSYFDKKSFANDTAKAKYLFAMIHDNIKEEHEKRLKYEQQQNNVVEMEVLDITNVQVKKKKSRGGISAFL